VEHIIHHYGIFAILLGAGIEGEPFALAGGVLAHRHWLSLNAAIMAAIGGAFLVDQMWFHLSRRFRQSRVIARIKSRPVFARSLGLIERHPIWFVLLFRFAYGLRAVAPVAIGASQIPTRLFVMLDLLTTIVWGVLFTILGSALGPAFEAMEARYGPGVALGAICLSAGVLFYALRRGHPRE
jgi:membrane protein DedA with SNARE-associated domain